DVKGTSGEEAVSSQRKKVQCMSIFWVNSQGWCPSTISSKYESYVAMTR
ncbi:Protein of unknown function, partial [Gryllus bimaculatus]